MPDTSPDFSVISSPRPIRAGTRRAAWLLPLALLGGFAVLFLLLFRDRLLPATEVRVVTALAIEEKIAASTARPVAEGRPLFQASGWVEPDPLPIRATALRDGIVDTVHVLEGQLVKKGELLASLVEDDARLELEAAAKEAEMAQAKFDAHCVNTQITLQQLEGEKSGLVADQANADEAAERLRRLEKAAASSMEFDLINARFEKSRTQAQLAIRQAKIDELSYLLTRIAFEAAGMRAEADRAQTGEAMARLAHERGRITAPVDGRVLRLVASPGAKKMLVMDDEDSSTIAILYDPAHLQVRVDVPLADAAGLGVGQRAKIRCNLLPDEVLEGEVTRISGEADLQRNTLQAKVRILNPPEKLRPEMLCRVEFLEAAAVTGAPVSDASGVAVYIPESSIQGDAVWICDPETRRASRRVITASRETRDAFRRIDEGVRPGEWVILDPAGLAENQRVSPKMEQGL